MAKKDKLDSWQCTECGYHAEINGIAIRRLTHRSKGLRRSVEDNRRMRSGKNVSAGKRVLVVEDESMIRLLIEDMLDDLGHTLAGEASSINEALILAREAEFDIAILDVDLSGQPIAPVVEILVARALPFVFATGYGLHGVPGRYRNTPTLQKPFDADALQQAINAVI